MIALSFSRFGFILQPFRLILWSRNRKPHPYSLKGRKFGPLVLMRETVTA